MWIDEAVRIRHRLSQQARRQPCFWHLRWSCRAHVRCGGASSGRHADLRAARAGLGHGGGWLCAGDRPAWRRDHDKRPGGNESADRDGVFLLRVGTGHDDHWPGRDLSSEAGPADPPARLPGDGCPVDLRVGHQIRRSDDGSAFDTVSSGKSLPSGVRGTARIGSAGRAG